jgi:hypothetical protein
VNDVAGSAGLSGQIAIGNSPVTTPPAGPLVVTAVHSMVASTGHNNQEGTGIGPYNIDVSSNEGPATPGLASIVAAASPGPAVAGEVGAAAVDVLVDSSGSWIRRPAAREHAARVMSKPYPRFSLDANPLTRSNPPPKEA